MNVVQMNGHGGTGEDKVLMAGEMDCMKLPGDVQGWNKPVFCAHCNQTVSEDCCIYCPAMEPLGCGAQGVHYNLKHSKALPTYIFIARCPHEAEMTKFTDEMSIQLFRKQMVVLRIRFT
jgi:hypothetical protein